eukprot:scaffold74321_cov22-Tisochrysis_lutea.AAC.1
MEAHHLTEIQNKFTIILFLSLLAALVSYSSRIIAALRALETRKGEGHALIWDPFAEKLAGPQAMAEVLGAALSQGEVMHVFHPLWTQKHDPDSDWASCNGVQNGHSLSLALVIGQKVIALKRMLIRVPGGRAARRGLNINGKNSRQEARNKSPFCCWHFVHKEHFLLSILCRGGKLATVAERAQQGPQVSTVSSFALFWCVPVSSHCHCFVVCWLTKLLVLDEGVPNWNSAKVHGIKGSLIKGPSDVHSTHCFLPAQIDDFVRLAVLANRCANTGQPVPAMSTRKQCKALLCRVLCEGLKVWGAHKVVLLGAGMDTRAWRLHLPGGVHWWEVDVAEVLEAKRAIMRRAGASFSSAGRLKKGAHQLQCASYA